MKGIEFTELARKPETIKAVADAIGSAVGSVGVNYQEPPQLAKIRMARAALAVMEHLVIGFYHPGPTKPTGDKGNEAAIYSSGGGSFFWPTRSEFVILLHEDGTQERLSWEEYQRQQFAKTIKDGMAQIERKMDLMLHDLQRLREAGW